MKLSKVEKMKFARIIFNSPGTETQQIDNLTDEQLQTLRSIYAQKIAYESVHRQCNAGEWEDRSILPPGRGSACSRTADTELAYECVLLFLSIVRKTQISDNRDYFDLTTSVFFSRLCYPIFFWNNGFLNINDGKAELYGIIWMILTYSIVLGLSATLNLFFIDPENFVFDNSMMISALGISVVFQIAEPLIYSSVVGCLGGFIYSNQGMMLSGYSLILYFVPTLFCIVPSLYWHILLMAFGSIVRAIFLFRSYASKLQSKTYIILLVIFILQAVYLVVTLRVMFVADVGFGFTDAFAAVFGKTPKITATSTASISLVPSELFYSAQRHFQS